MLVEGRIWHHETIWAVFMKNKYQLQYFKRCLVLERKKKKKAASLWELEKSGLVYGHCIILCHCIIIIWLIKKSWNPHCCSPHNEWFCSWPWLEHVHRTTSLLWHTLTPPYFSGISGDLIMKPWSPAGKKQCLVLFCGSLKLLQF